MTTRELRPGEALPLEFLGNVLADVLHLRFTSQGPPPDLVALVTGAGGKVRTDDDFVFYNNPGTADGTVTWLPEGAAVQWIKMMPSRLDGGVERVVVAASEGSLLDGRSAALTLVVTDPAGNPLCSAEIVPDPGLSALVLLEVYRRGAQWRLRLLAQGYAAGLAALASEYGVEIDDSDAELGDVGESVDAPRATESATSPATITDWAVTPVAGLRTDRGAASPPRPRRTLFTSRRRTELQAQNDQLQRLLVASGAMDNAAIDTERRRLLAEVGDLSAQAQRRRAEIEALDRRHRELLATIKMAEGEQELTEVGIYRYRHRLDDAVAYKARLDALREQMKALAKSGHAVSGATNWTVNGSVAQGRKMVKEVSKLMLRAYNADADHAVRTLRPYKIDSALVRFHAHHHRSSGINHVDRRLRSIPSPPLQRIGIDVGLHQQAR